MNLLAKGCYPHCSPPEPMTLVDFTIPIAFGVVCLIGFVWLWWVCR